MILKKNRERYYPPHKVEQVNKILDSRGKLIAKFKHSFIIPEEWLETTEDKKKELEKT